jgi:hypothetical protein
MPTDPRPWNELSRLQQGLVRLQWAEPESYWWAFYNGSALCMQPALALADQYVSDAE